MPRTAVKRLPRSQVMETLRALHKDSGLTGRAVAEKAGMPYPTVADWVRGKEPQAFALLERLAKVYGRRLVLEPLAD